MVDRDLRELGLKLTGPRRKILKALEEANSRHLGAEDVYRLLSEQGEDVGLATIYRVLTQFESAGLVIRHRFEEGRAVFELDEGEHHDHMVCVRCGNVSEFVDEAIEQRQQTIATESGFKMTDHSLTIYGICGQCQ